LQTSAIDNALTDERNARASIDRKDKRSGTVDPRIGYESIVPVSKFDW
jgi:hypothetical protein